MNLPRTVTVIAVAALLAGCAIFEPPPPPPPTHFQTITKSQEPLPNHEIHVTTSYQVTLPFDGTVHLVVQYQDLDYENDPVVETRTLAPDETTFTLKSPPLPAPQPYVDYEILLKVYSDAELIDLITTHRDWVRFLTEK